MLKYVVRRADALDMRLAHRWIVGSVVASCALAPQAAHADTPLAVTPPGDAGQTNDTTPVLTGTAHDEAGDGPTVDVGVRGGAIDLIGTVPRSGTTWTTEPLPALPEGRYAITVTQDRFSGATEEARGVLVVDVTPPTMSLAVRGAGTAPDGATIVFNPFAVGLVSPDSGAAFACAVDAAAFAPCSPGGRGLGYAGYRLANGRHVVRARPTDRAGNVGAVVEQAVLVAATPTAPAPSRFTGPASNVTLRPARRIRVPSTGRVRIDAVNANPFRLAARAELRTVAALPARRGRRTVRRTRVLARRAGITVGASGRTSIDLVLGTAARRLLHRSGRLRVRMTVRLLDSDGKVRTERATTTLVG